jgi:flavin reductase ActVB
VNAARSDPASTTGEVRPVGAAMEIDGATFRRVMRSLAAGVTVATVRDKQGYPWGLTATAVCLVSWKPPLLLVCIDQTAECHPAFLAAEAFAINLLRGDQESLSRHFGRKAAGKFGGIPWRSGRTGAPLLENVLAHVESRTVARFPGGDHTIFVGEAVGATGTGPSKDGSPLLYFRGRYAQLRGTTPPDGS